MQQAKLLNMPALFILLFAAACQSPKPGSDQSTDTVAQAQSSHKILFRDSFPKATDYVNDYDFIYTADQKTTLIA
jgi:hypothetical protein